MLHVCLLKKDVKDLFSVEHDWVSGKLKNVTVLYAAFRVHLVAFKENFELHSLIFDVLNLIKFLTFFIDFRSILWLFLK